MSIQKRQRRKGNVYVVHYYDADARKYVNKTFDLRKDAVAFESMVNLAKRRGELAELDAGQESLRAFLDEYWSRHGDRFLSENTRKAYKDLEKRFVLEELGDLPLRRLSPNNISALRDAVLDRSGQETARKTLAFLQGVLERAMEWERIRTNPVKAVRKPGRTRQSRPRPLSPAEVEGIRAQLAGRDATLVSLLAYAGLRPGEALALTWEDVGANTIRVDKSLSFGDVKGTKTGGARIVRPFRAAMADLRSRRMETGLRSGLIFPKKDGSPWRDTTYRNWRRRTWAPAATGVRPYDLRHSFASLLFAEGQNPAYIAEQLGHSIQTLLSTYVHIIEELRDTERVDGNELIRKARSGDAGASSQTGS